MSRVAIVAGPCSYSDSSDALRGIAAGIAVSMYRANSDSRRRLRRLRLREDLSSCASPYLLAASTGNTPMIRQGSILSFAGWPDASDLRLKVLRFDASTDLYHLESTRALRESTIERWILHSWIRRKAVIIERRETK